MANFFVGLAVTAAAPAELQRLERQAPGARWVPAAGWHVTLQFLGGLDATREAVIIAELAAVREPRFGFGVCGLGMFPDRRRPRILWAGVREETGRFVALAAAVGRALGTAGFAPELHPFHPHVTLARGRPGDLKPLLPWLEAGGPDWGWQTAEAFFLFRTRSGGAEAHRNPYEVRRRFALE